MLNNLQISAQTNQKIASIGCGGGLWEIAWAFELDNVHFYLEDINESLLNESEVENTIQYFEKKYNKATNCTFRIVIGNTKETKLPTNFFDRVLLINSFHEFEEQPIMLAECHRILKPNGQLVIEEQLAQYTGELHKGCGKRLFMEEELIKKLSASFTMLAKTIDGKKILISYIK
jgi:ubiquinone/menaquinone biosynthesis C-methylase UbiE